MFHSFDECFQTLPRTKIPGNFDSFWKESLQELKKIPISPIFKSTQKDSVPWKSIQEFSFQSIGNYTVHGKLALPIRPNPAPILIRFHDYFAPESDFTKEYAELGIAELILQLRGHSLYELETPVSFQSSTEKKQWSPGYFSVPLQKPEDFYMRKVFLDSFRCLEFVRLLDFIQTDKIFLQGKSLGAALSIFLASFSDRISGVLLETPSFCNLNPEFIDPTSDCLWMQELKDVLTEEFHYNTLALFDPINFASKIKAPILYWVGLEDTKSDPRNSFALFHSFSAEKSMHLFPKEGNQPGRKKKNAVFSTFLREILQV